jgi:hypothetical protein
MILVSTEDAWANIELAKVVIEMLRDYTHEYRDSLLRR